MRDNYSLTEDNLGRVIKRVTTRCEALCSRAFIPSRAQFTFQATKIHYNLSHPRLASYNIRGVSASKNAQPPSHLLFSLPLSFSSPLPSYIPLRCLNGVSVQYNLGTHKNDISRRGFDRASVWSFWKLRTMSSRALRHTLHRARIVSGTLFRHRVAEIRDRLFREGKSESEQSGGRRGWETGENHNRRRGWMSNKRGKSEMVAHFTKWDTPTPIKRGHTYMYIRDTPQI